MTDLTEIERDVRVPAPAHRVWEVVIGPDWLAEEVQLELVPGGEAQFGGRAGWVEEATPPAEDPGGVGRLIFWWSGEDQPASRVELTLEPDGDSATRLRVVESRPLERLDLTGIASPGAGQRSRPGGSTRGPAMLVTA